MTAVVNPAAGLRCQIAKFASLTNPNVAEHMHTTWGDALAWLAEEPAGEYAGQLAHGGWSPVRYDPPKRAKDHVREVYALVLDHDKGGNWDRVRALWQGHYGLLYTTKSHGAPDVSGDRLRVVLPLARAVTIEEYPRIWEWASQQSQAAGSPVDPQAKDVSRFWYDTSPPPGGWRAEVLTGAPIDPDTILALADKPKLRLVADRAPVPDGNQRAHRAAKYLDRIPGAVAGQSGHTTTFNAVAHVMIGFDLDPDTTLSLIQQHYNPRCSPEWSEKELLHKIRSVAEKCARPRGYLLQAERKPIHTVQQAADRAPALPEEHEINWRTEVIQKKDGSFKRGVHNTSVFVKHHPTYRGKWSRNTMTGEVWFDGAPMLETLVHEIRAQIDVTMGYSPGREDVDGAIAAAAQERPFHPIQQYLRSIDWDGTPRLASMARDYLHSEDPLHAQLVRKWMISAVARALRPGCKVDTALMLYGQQGFFKSSFFAILGGTWHADSPIDIASKDSFQQIHAAWIYEFAELENVVTGRAESRLKAWLTSTHDMYRAPYARQVVSKPRSCVIAGTTNRATFLTDDTGSRRFWIIPVVQEIPRDLLAEMRDQLWAEAVCAYEAGETWWLDRQGDNEREEANADYHEGEDPWRPVLVDWLATPSRREVSITDLLKSALEIDAQRMDRMSQMRVAKILTDLGWKRRRMGEPRRYVYQRQIGGQS
jgi:hypothetical protein